MFLSRFKYSSCKPTMVLKPDEQSSQNVTISDTLDSGFDKDLSPLGYDVMYVGV